MAKQLSGWIVGAATSGALSFLAGFLLPLLLEPSSNLGPAIGCFVLPLAILEGAVVGDLVSRFSVASLSKAVLIGAGIGAAVPTIFILKSGGVKSGADSLIFMTSSTAILGLTGALVCWSGPRSSNHTGPPYGENSEGNRPPGS